jgi:molybdopterin synthase sulfur carrier subunit
VSQVTVRYFAGAQAAAGVAEESASAPTLAELCALLAQAHGARLAQVLTACSFLVDGVAARDFSVRLPAGGTVDVLPPFAGG